MVPEDTNSSEETKERLPINRREFLNYAWLVSIGFFTISAACVTYLLHYHASKKVNSVE